MTEGEPCQSARNLLNADADLQFFDGGHQLYSSNYAIKDGEFFGVNRQPPRPESDI